MRRFVIYLLLAIWGATLSPAALPSSRAQDAPDPAYTLHLYHTNDQHAHHRPDREGVGGAARLLTVLNEARATHDNLLVVDAGDRFSGTLFHYFYQGQDNAQVMAMLGYDVMALGNHEFDNGSEPLAEFIGAVDFPVLAANVDVSADPLLADLIEPYVVLTVGGEQIGVIGLVTPRTAIISQPAAGIVFDADLVAVTQQAVAELTAQGVHKIILLTHIGYDEDLLLAEAIVAGTIAEVDVIVGGHTNTIPRPYPTVFSRADGSLVAVVQAGAHGVYVGHLVLGFDADGALISLDGELLRLTPDIAEDPAMVALLDELEAPVSDLTAQVVGQTAFAYARNCYGRECDLGVLITDAMQAATDADIVLMNSGGIRDELPAGDVTYGDILSVLPFGNQIAVFELSGAAVLQALEHGVSGDVDGKFPQVAGIRFVWEPSAPDGERIVSVEVWNATDAVWQALDPTATYTVATNDFMLGGGDGYQVLVDEAVNVYASFGSLDLVVADYIAANSPVANNVEGRIRTQ